MWLVFDAGTSVGDDLSGLLASRSFEAYDKPLAGPALKASIAVRRWHVLWLTHSISLKEGAGLPTPSSFSLALLLVAAWCPLQELPEPVALAAFVAVVSSYPPQQNTNLYPSHRRLPTRNHHLRR